MCISCSFFCPTSLIKGKTAEGEVPVNGCTRRRCSVEFHRYRHYCGEAFRTFLSNWSCIILIESKEVIQCCWRRGSVVLHSAHRGGKAQHSVGSNVLKAALLVSEPPLYKLQQHEQLTAGHTNNNILFLLVKCVVLNFGYSVMLCVTDIHHIAKSIHSPIQIIEIRCSNHF